MNADASGQTNLTNNGQGSDAGPSWMPGPTTVSVIPTAPSRLIGAIGEALGADTPMGYNQAKDAVKNHINSGDDSDKGPTDGLS